MKRYQRWTLWSFGLVGVLCAAIVVLIYVAPAIGIVLASRWYANQGEGYSFSVGSWEFQPLATRLVLNNVRFSHPSLNGDVTTLDAIELEINARALLDRHVQVHSLIMNGLAVDVGLAQNPELQLLIAGIYVPLMADSSSDSVNVSHHASEPWRIDVNRLELIRQRLNWDLVFNELSTSGRIQLNHASIYQFSNQAEDPLKLHFDLLLKEFNLRGSSVLTLLEPLSLVMSGEVQDVLSDPAFQGSINGHELEVLLNDIQHIQFESIEITNITANTQKQYIDEINIHELSLSQNNTLLASLDSYVIENVTLNFANDPLQFELGQHDFSGLNLYFSINEEDELVGFSASDEINPALILAENTQEIANFSVKNVSKEADVHPKKSSSEQVENVIELVEAVELTPENDQPEIPNVPISILMRLMGFAQQFTPDLVPGVIHIQDHSINPILNTKITVQELAVGSIDARIDGDSIELIESFPLRLIAGLDQFNRIEVDGKLGIYRRDGFMYPQGRMQLQIKQLNLVKFNGYLIKALGYQLERGLLDVDGTIIFDKGQLGGELKLLLRNSRFVPVDKTVIDRVQRQISMPIETALDLLRDGNGNVHLTIPLSGDLTNPNIGINDILIQVTQRATRTGALFFLSQALQPYGALVALAVYAGDHLFTVRLDAIAFAQGQSELTPEQVKHLTTMGQLLQEKPGLEVQACPFVSEAEANDLGSNWQALAQARGENIKAWLTQFDKSVGARLSLCHPQRGKAAEVIMGVN